MSFSNSPATSAGEVREGFHDISGGGPEGHRQVHFGFSEPSWGPKQVLDEKKWNGSSGSHGGRGRRFRPSEGLLLLPCSKRGFLCLRASQSVGITALRATRIMDIVYEAGQKVPFVQNANPLIR